MWLSTHKGLSIRLQPPLGRHAMCLSPTDCPTAFRRVATRSHKLVENVLAMIQFASMRLRTCA